MKKNKDLHDTATAESMAHRQRDISVSEFFLKNRHLLGFDNPRRALLTTVKEAVDNSLDACEEAGVLPEISVDIVQTSAERFRIDVTDNGPGIVRAQIPKIFAKLLYGSKFHRLRMSRGQQGIGISAAGMYGQLTTGSATRIRSKIKGSRKAHQIEVQIDTRKNTPTVLKDIEIDWYPAFPSPTTSKDGAALVELIPSSHGTSVAIEMEATYVRGRLSVDEYLRQCALANPHLQLHYRIILTQNDERTGPGDDTELLDKQPAAMPEKTALARETPWISFPRVTTAAPRPPVEIKPHPHGVELGMLIQMLKDTPARTVRSMLSQDFSRISSATAAAICEKAGLNPMTKPARIAALESEALYKAIGETKLMRPPTDCLSPIGETLIMEGLNKELHADFCTAVSRPPTVYRGNPFQIEVGIAYVRPQQQADNMGADETARILRFANRVPLLYMAGGCAITKAVSSVNWRHYGLAQPRGSLPVGPMVLFVHIASVWVPFTSESKEAIAHYPEILREIVACLQECGRQLSVFLNRRRRQAELERKRNYIELYIPHLAVGLKDILDLNDKQEKTIVVQLRNMLERTHLQA